MARIACGSVAISVALLALLSLGCQPSPPEPVSPEPTIEDPDHADHDQNDEVRAALAGLSPADRESVEQQRICPVSGQLLGSMGEPLKVEVQDREVWICCAGCEAPLQEDPQQYLAQLNNG